MAGRSRHALISAELRRSRERSRVRNLGIFHRQRLYDLCLDLVLSATRRLEDLGFDVPNLHEALLKLKSFSRRTSGQKRPGNETNCDTKDARGSSRRELRYLKALSVISLTPQWIPEKGPNEPRSPDDPSGYRTTCLFANVSGG